MTKQEFLNAYTPEAEDGVHPDKLAVNCGYIEGFDPEWCDDQIERSNGQFLSRGYWLFPSGQIIDID